MSESRKPWLRTLVKIQVPLYLVLIFGLPVEVLVAIWNVWNSTTGHALLSILSPLAYTTLFVVVAGGLSVPHHKGIVAGKFPRDVAHSIYYHRRIYGLCWTSLYYFKPLYYLCLTIPTLKLITFRLFGYKGQLDFTIYPDTWIRDLPLLDFGEGAYIANRATLGTNLALSNGMTMVGPIRVGKHATIGHLVAMAPGCEFDEGVEIGSVTAIGYKSTFGEKCSIQPGCSIEHGVRIGSGCMVGATTYIGTSAQIAEGIVIPPGSVIAPRTRIRSTEDLKKIK